MGKPNQIYESFESLVEQGELSSFESMVLGNL